MPAHHRAWQEILRRRGAPFILSQEEFYGLGGVPTPEVARILNRRYGTEYDPEAIAMEKEGLFLEFIHEIRPVEDIVQLARKFFRTHPVAVASGGDRDIVRKILAAIGVLELFPVIVTREDVEKGKPAPDLFLLAARRMGVAPAQCLVFEDAPLGLEAAARAGMSAVFVPPVQGEKSCVS